MGSVFHANHGAVLRPWFLFWEGTQARKRGRGALVWVSGHRGRIAMRPYMVVQGRAEGQSPSPFLILPPKEGDQRGLNRLCRAGRHKHQGALWSRRGRSRCFRVAAGATGVVAFGLHERAPMRQPRYLCGCLYVARQNRKTAAASSDASLLHDSNVDLAAGRASGNPRPVRH